MLPLAERGHVVLETNGLRLFLDRLTSRSALTGAEQAAILGLPFDAVVVRANHDFVRLGERVDHSCYVAAGMVGRFGHSSEGSRQITAIHVPGDMADLHSVVQPRACSALQALSRATILRVPHRAIRAATMKFPALGEALWRDCMVDASILSQWVVNVGRRNAKSRIAHLLCEMALRLQSSAGTFRLGMTQLQIADATGLTSVHVNRIVKLLRQEHIADLGREEVRILDWNLLVAAADFDPAYLQVGGKPR